MLSRNPCKKRLQCVQFGTEAKATPCYNCACVALGRHRDALGVYMLIPVTRAERQGFGHLRLKLRNLGAEASAIDAVLKQVHVSAACNPSEDIVVPGQSPRRSTVLLEGVACLYERLDDGSRRIFAFHYPGDFCDFSRHVLPETDSIAVAAITRCLFGRIPNGTLEQLLIQHSSLATAIWRISLLDAGMLRQKLLIGSQRSALQRMSHLLCELLARQETVGINDACIHLAGSDLADATGLSIVHVSRTFTKLRKLKLLAREGRTMKIVDRNGLAALALFDGRYLNMPQLLANWQVEPLALRGLRQSMAHECQKADRP